MLLIGRPANPDTFGLLRNETHTDACFRNEVYRTRREHPENSKAPSAPARVCVCVCATGVETEGAKRSAPRVVTLQCILELFRTEKVQHKGWVAPEISDFCVMDFLNAP